MPTQTPFNISATEIALGMVQFDWEDSNTAPPDVTFHPEAKIGVLNPVWVPMAVVQAATATSIIGTFAAGVEVCFRIRSLQDGEYSKYSATTCIQLSEADEPSIIQAKFTLSGDCKSIRFHDLTGRQPYHFAGYPAGASVGVAYEGWIRIKDVLGVDVLGEIEVTPRPYPAHFNDIAIESIVPGGLAEGVYVIEYEVSNAGGPVVGTFSSNLIIDCSTMCKITNMGWEVAIRNGISDKSKDFCMLASLIGVSVPAAVQAGDPEDANEILEFVKTQANICC